MMKLNIKTLTMFFFIFISLSIYGQENNGYYLIRTLDGNIFHGKILSSTEDSITIDEYNIGKISLKKSLIRKITNTESKDTLNTASTLHSAAGSKYVLAPSAFSLKKGEAYYQNTMLFVNQFSYGITNGLSVGFTGVPLFIVDEDPSLFAFYAKYSSPIYKKLRWSIGAMAGNLFQDIYYLAYDLDSYLVNTQLTHGNPRNNITIGYTTNLNLSGRMLSLNAAIKIYKRFNLISENHWIKDNNKNHFFIEESRTHILSLRYLNNYIIADAGILMNSDMYYSEIFPGLAVTVPLRFPNSENYHPKKRKMLKKFN